MNLNLQHAQQRVGQRGAVLVVCLLVLLMMTLIGVTGMQSTSLEEKMAGNTRDRNLAFQAAESALRAGQNFLLTNPFVVNCATGFRKSVFYYDLNCDGTNDTDANGNPIPVWQNPTLWSGNTTIAYDAGTLSNMAAAPRYIIEELPKTCQVKVNPCPSGSLVGAYRITARGTGGSLDAVVILQAMVMG